MRKLVFGLIMALGLSMFPATAHADTLTSESEFVTRINTLRSGLGLPTLQVNQNLVTKARAWAQGMAAAGRIWHSTLSDGVTEDWQKLGENVGMGGSVDGLHKAFVASPHHYDNLVDPSFGSVGIGIVMNGDTMYVSEVFMQLMAPRPTKAVTITTATTPPPAAPPLTITTAPRPTPPPKPVAPKLPLAPKAPVPVTTFAASPPPVATAPPAPVTPAEPPAPVEELTAPPAPPRAPSALLVSVLERLRTFDA